MSLLQNRMPSNDYKPTMLADGARGCWPVVAGVPFAQPPLSAERTATVDATATAPAPCLPPTSSPCAQPPSAEYMSFGAFNPAWPSSGAMLWCPPTTTTAACGQMAEASQRCLSLQPATVAPPMPSTQTFWPGVAVPPYWLPPQCMWLPSPSPGSAGWYGAGCVADGTVGPSVVTSPAQMTQRVAAVCSQPPALWYPSGGMMPVHTAMPVQPSADVVAPVSCARQSTSSASACSAGNDPATASARQRCQRLDGALTMRGRGNGGGTAQRAGSRAQSRPRPLKRRVVAVDSDGECGVAVGHVACQPSELNAGQGGIPALCTTAHNSGDGSAAPVTPLATSTAHCDGNGVGETREVDTSRGERDGVDAPGSVTKSKLAAFVMPPAGRHVTVTSPTGCSDGAARGGSPPQSSARALPVAPQCEDSDGYDSDDADDSDDDVVATRRERGARPASSGASPVVKFHFCTRCSYRTTRQGDLISHSRIHAGFKTRQCEWCAYTTTDTRYGGGCVLSRSELVCGLKIEATPTCVCVCAPTMRSPVAADALSSIRHNSFHFVALPCCAAGLVNGVVARGKTAVVRGSFSSNGGFGSNIPSRDRCFGVCLCRPLKRARSNLNRHQRRRHAVEKAIRDCNAALLQ